MKYWLIPVCAASITLLGCNSEGGGSGGSGELNVSLKTPTFVIDAENRSTVDGMVADSALSATASDFAAFDSSRSLERSVFRSASGIELRNTESASFDCDGGGSYTISVSGSGISDDELSASGNATIKLIANNCITSFGTWEDVEDGTTELSMTWSGYDGFDSFDSLSVSVRFDEVTYQEYEDGVLYYSESIDGAISASISGNESRVQIALSGTSSDLNNQTITMETTTPIKQRLSDDYPYQGVVEVKGGGGTSVVYTVVANGVEISLNGGQPALVTWNEI